MRYNVRIDEGNSRAVSHLFVHFRFTSYQWKGDGCYGNERLHIRCNFSYRNSYRLEEDTRKTKKIITLFLDRTSDYF